MNPQLPRSTLFLLGSALFLSFLLIVIALSFFLQKSEDPTKRTTIDTTRKNLSTKEKQLPLATPQPYKDTSGTYTRSMTGSDTGTLVVSSNVEKAWVTIDPQEGAGAEGKAVKKAEIVPTQYTPFTIQKLPVGKHLMIASKPDYIAQTIEFEIKKDQVTRINLEIKPIHPNE